MSAADVVHGMLTALFAGAAVHTLRQAALTRGAGWRGRGDVLLHTVMAAAMAVMPWQPIGDGPAPGWTALFFAAAALWFPLTAVLGLRLRGPGWADLVHRSPHAVGMAAMAWMPVRHSGVTDAGTGDLVTAALTLFLLAHALRSLTQDMPTLRGASGGVSISTDLGGPCARFWQGSTAMGTALMLLMHH
ncbi:DUF5134 domain-containing protein [Streptomyces sp. WI04-05B]|uniref:DUF5134 domain-containing protein n=1 Tax=Streptomyces TaxID=1883 RepID=UPI0029A3C244|nr:MULTISPECIES: DUF5134 domain-containing protein [unclassified Streptomyces]MDX2546243.1 DUF5134 domain-containing protein [Streptomyces sp. WI04-05B]MDX2583266.1 DUF5134 domain-containing protein [Streptomyces sp. WI04-05A]MDX3745033.1 DUF5134 domain-containing protein [Streptomyces sp. AK08-02]